MKRNLISISVMAVVWWSVTTATAQTIGDPGDYSNESHLIDGVTETVSGDYYVGDEGTNNLLEIIAGGKLVGGETINVGDAESAMYNSILITGAGSELACSGSVMVGRSRGSYNLVTVDDEAVVNSGNLNVGISSGASYNLVVVTNNAQWNVADTTVGHAGAFSNRLVVTDGSVLSGDGILRAGYLDGSDYNRIHILNGATVTNITSIYPGREASHNEIVVSGTGSALYGLNVRMSIGDWVTGNRLAIEDGGLLELTSYLRVGEDATSSYESLEVTGTGSQLRVPTRAVKVGHRGTHHSLTVSDGASVHSDGIIVGNEDGSEYNVMTVSGGAEVVSGGPVIIGNEEGSKYNQMYITDAELTSGGSLLLGFEGAHNTGEISGGSTVDVGEANVGVSAGSDHNQLLISGTDTEFDNSGFFIVGATGSHNRVTIDDGAVVTSGNALYVGLRGGSHNLMVVTNNAEYYHTGGSVSQVGLNGGVSNRLVVTDGALFSFHSTLRAGNSAGADYNSVHVLNGAAITSASSSRIISIGRDGASHNEFLISGTDSALYANNVRMSDDGAGIGNRLAIEDGGLLELTSYLRVGEHADSVSNRLDVTGAGSQLLVPARAVKVGHGGTYNVMTVSNGALVSADGFIVGRNAGSEHNALYAGGAQLVSSGDFSIGQNGDYNTGVISGGSTVTVDNVIYIGESSSHNELLVTGGETTMYSGDGVRVGFGAGSDYNRMVLSGGATYTNRGGYRLHDHVGYQGGSHNELIVEGPGTVWDGARIYLGWDDGVAQGTHNRVVITNQGRVLLGTQMMLHGISNRLEIVDGGEMISDGSFFRVGGTTDSDYNLVEVSGMDSLLHVKNSQNLVVGNDASHNRLTVADSGVVQVDYDLAIGVDGGQSNRVTVGEWGSLEVDGTIFVSAGGAEGNRLEIQDGGFVQAPETVVGTNGVVLLESGSTLMSALTIQESGLLTGDGEIMGAVDNYGVIAPGQSAGELEIAGNLTLRDGSVLEMELGGTTEDAYDRLIAGMGTHTVAFGGTLSVALIGGFTPQDGDEFQLFDLWDFAGSSGSFDVYDLPDLSGYGLGWDRSQVESDGMLTVIPEPSTGLLLAGFFVLLALRRRRM